MTTAITEIKLAAIARAAVVLKLSADDALVSAKVVVGSTAIIKTKDL